MIQLMFVVVTTFGAYLLECLSNAVKHHREHSWETLTPHRRAVIRWSVILVIAATVYGLVTARLATEICLATAGMLLVVLLERHLQSRVKSRHVNRGTVRPLSEAVASQLSVTPQQANRSITIRPDYVKSRGMENIGTIVLPDHYAANPAQREMLEHLVRSRLGVDTDFTWHTSKKPMTLELARAPIPATLVPLADMIPSIRALPRDKILLGLTGRAEPKLWDMTSEEPHALVSANTRRGKTRLLLLIVCQALRQGAEKITIIDPKRVGVDECLAGIPGVSVLNNPRDVPAMWAAIRRFREHMDSRVDAYMDDRTLDFNRSLLVIDELSQFAAMSKVYWDSIREKGDKALPPVWNDVAAILWQGAQFACSMLVFGQRIEHSTLGGLIDSFGTRLLAGFTKRTYERLVGVPPVPASQRPKGRFLFYDGEQPVWIQTVLGSDQELRSLALEGKPIAKPTLAEILEVTENRGR